MSDTDHTFNNDVEFTTPITHPRSGTIHETADEDQPDIGTRTLCGLVLPNTPNRFNEVGPQCELCRKVSQSRENQE